MDARLPPPVVVKEEVPHLKSSYSIPSLAKSETPQSPVVPYLYRFNFLWKFFSKSAAAFFWRYSKLVLVGGFFSGGFAIEEAPLDPKVPLMPRWLCCTPTG